MSGIERWNHEKHISTKKTPIYTATQGLYLLLLNCQSLGGPSGKTLISSWRVPHNLSSSHWSGWNVSPRVLCWRLDLQPVLSRGHGEFQSWDPVKAVNSRRSCSGSLLVLPSVQKALWSLWVEKLLKNSPHPVNSCLSVVPKQGLQPPWTEASEDKCPHQSFLLLWFSGHLSWPQKAGLAWDLTSHRYYTEKLHSWHLNFSATHSNQNAIQSKKYPETKRLQLLIHITT